MRFYVWDSPTIGRSIEIERRLVGLGLGGACGVAADGNQVSLGMKKMFETGEKGWLHNIVYAR